MFNIINENIVQVQTIIVKKISNVVSLYTEELKVLTSVYDPPLPKL